MNRRSGLRPIILGATWSRYSISIRTICGGNVELDRALVLDLARRDIERRHRTWSLVEEEVHVEGEADQVLHADRQVDQDFDGNRCLGNRERAEVGTDVATHLGPQL